MCNCNSSKFTIFEILILRILNFASPVKISASKITCYTVTILRVSVMNISLDLPSTFLAQNPAQSCLVHWIMYCTRYCGSIKVLLNLESDDISTNTVKLTNMDIKFYVLY